MRKILFFIVLLSLSVFATQPTVTLKTSVQTLSGSVIFKKDVRGKLW